MMFKLMSECVCNELEKSDNHDDQHDRQCQNLVSKSKYTAALSDFFYKQIETAEKGAENLFKYDRAENEDEPN